MDRRRNTNRNSVSMTMITCWCQTSPPGGGGRVCYWSTRQQPIEPVVVVSTGGGTVCQHGGCQDNMCATESEFSRLDDRPAWARRGCAPFADPMVVVVWEARRAPCRRAPRRPPRGCPKSGLYPVQRFYN